MIETNEMTNDDFFIVDYTAPKSPPRTYTKLTPAARRVLRYYIGLVQSESSTKFCRSLKTISGATGVPIRTITTANDCLRQLGYLDWRRGHNGVGAYDCPNRYTLLCKAGNRTRGHDVTRSAGHVVS